MCRQGYYRWRAQGPCQRERTDAELTEVIRAIHTKLSGDPGVRRVHAELVVQGHRVWRKTTIAGQRPLDAPDLIGQDFTAEQPTTRWCGDITSIKTLNGWVYTANLDVSTPDQAAAVEHWYRHRTTIENIFRDAKHGAALRHLPSGYAEVNTAWMWGALLAVSMAGWLHQLTATPTPRARCGAGAPARARP